MKRKQFYDTRAELPSERVSKITKGNLRKVFVNSLLYLSNKLEIPYCRLPYNIDNKPNFIFRIDTDFCTKQEAMDLLMLLRDNDIKATWFIDTANDDLMQNFYANLEDQEIGLHCKRHIVFNDYQSNLKNITDGLDSLQKAGISVKGYAAPYGEWNPNLDRVLQEKGFVYSSEFSWDYDNLPSYPIVKNNKSSVLQIPIHPISIGRLVRSHYHDNEIFQYFQKVIDDKINENLPVMIYYHPHRGKHEILTKIFSYIKQRKMLNITMGEYADWWKQRLKSDFEVDFNNDELSFKATSSDLPMVIHLNNKVAVTEIKENLKLDELAWFKMVPKPLIEVARARKFNWRTLLYDFESTKGRLKQ